MSCDIWCIDGRFLSLLRPWISLLEGLTFHSYVCVSPFLFFWHPVGFVFCDYGLSWVKCYNIVLRLNQLLQPLGPLWSDAVIKLVSVLFGKCTTLVVTKCWPMETRLPCGDQWKVEKLGAFWRWPITRCFIKSDRAGLIIEHSINFRLNSEHWRAVRFPQGNWPNQASVSMQN